VQWLSSDALGPDGSISLTVPERVQLAGGEDAAAVRDRRVSDAPATASVATVERANRQPSRPMKALMNLPWIRASPPPALKQQAIPSLIGNLNRPYRRLPEPPDDAA